MRKLFGILTIGAVAFGLGLASSPALADCGGNSKFATNSASFFGGAGTSYIRFPGAVDSSTFKVRFWQTSNPVNNEGAWTPVATNFIQDPFGPPYTTSDDFIFLLDLNPTGPGPGCPINCLTLYIEDSATGHFIQWTVPEGGVNTPAEFDFTQASLTPPYGAGPAGLSPRARVTSSGRAGNNVTVNFDIPDVSGGVFALPGANCVGGTGQITGRQVYIQQSPTMPSTNIAGWIPLGAELAGAAGSDARSNPFDCTNTASDWWVAIGLEQNNVAPRFVSTPVQIECDPNLANPTGGFKKIDRPAPAPRTQGQD